MIEVMFRRNRTQESNASAAAVAGSEPGRQWAEALAAWAIPDHILAAAPEDPWAHPPKRFAASDEDRADTPSMRAAAAMLAQGGSVLDVGCGGGRSSIPLTTLAAYSGDPLVTELTGFDANAIVCSVRSTVPTSPRQHPNVATRRHRFRR